MSPTGLAEMFLEAESVGWSLRDFETAPSLEDAVRDLPCIADRAEDPVIGRVQPQAEADHQRSLSARHGLSRFPLHTDGAHHKFPPAYLLFTCPNPPRVARTRLLYLGPDADAMYREYGRGVFAVTKSETDRWLANAFDGKKRLRFDRGCMAPLDEVARGLVRYVESRESGASEIEWTSANAVLVIDNRLTLHGRSATSIGDTFLNRVWIREETK